MVEFKVELKDQEVKIRANRLIRKNPALSRQILGELGEAIVARTNTHYLSGQVLNRKTGKLAQSVNKKYNNDYSVSVGSNLRYAAIHEFGGTIVPRTASMLSFLVEGGWVMTSKVVMPKRPWLAPSVQDVMNTHIGQNIMDRNVRRWLNKEWETR